MSTNYSSAYMNKNVLKYKEYQGTVHYSHEDKCLYGKVIGIEDLVNYEAETVSELNKAFKESVEDYLETCKALNKKPLRAYKGAFNIRTTPEKHQTLSILAQKNGLKLNQLVNMALDQYLENTKDLS